MARHEAIQNQAEAVSERIRTLSEQFLHAVNRRDLETILTFCTPEAVILPPLRPAVSGRAAIGEYIKSLLDAGLSDLAVQPIELQHSGGLVVEIGFYTLRVPGKDGSTVGDKGKYVTSWRRQPDGEFRITSSIWSSDQNLGIYER